MKTEVTVEVAEFQENEVVLVEREDPDFEVIQVEGCLSAMAMGSWF